MGQDDRTLARVARTTWALGLAGSVAAFVFLSLPQAIAFAAGAVLAGLNFEAIRRLGRRLMVPGRGRGAVGLVLATKVVALFAALYVLIVPLKLDGVMLGAGASALVAAILIEGFRSSLAPPEVERV